MAGISELLHLRSTTEESPSDARQRDILWYAVEAFVLHFRHIVAPTTFHVTVGRRDTAKRPLFGSHYRDVEGWALQSDANRNYHASRDGEVVESDIIFVVTTSRKLAVRGKTTNGRIGSLELLNVSQLTPDEVGNRLAYIDALYKILR